MKLDYMWSVCVCVFFVSNYIGYLWYCLFLFLCVVFVIKLINILVIIDEVMFRIVKWVVCIYNIYCYFLINIVLVIDMYLINKEGIFGYDLVDFNRLILFMFVIYFVFWEG